jgi:hypothetical protein
MLTGCQRSGAEAGSTSTGATSRATSTGARALFEKVDALIATQPFTNERVERLTGHHLRAGSRIPFYESKDEGNPWFAAVELRGASFLSLEVQPKLCISEEEVMARFGDKPELSFPTAPAPQSTPVYLAYKPTWGRLSFGFARTGARCLMSVILDAH